MNQFKITISMVNYLLYVIIIMLIYGIKIIRKMPIILTPNRPAYLAGAASFQVCPRRHGRVFGVVGLGHSPGR
jgi:hypothetical protein